MTPPRDPQCRAARPLPGVARAARRYEELEAIGRRLHFEVETEGVRIEVRDLEGNTLRAISPSEALAVASGAPP